ncbi:hypothetical protein M569_17742 [Genlisea aurea]|uniref:Secreted protein n=1 Tax=Genlisea aurea TaxID=192259 RepID=S8D349_9LAMI|nr:hypothetical protein M569_17742 [Genlisea aurea]
MFDFSSRASVTLPLLLSFSSLSLPKTEVSRPLDTKLVAEAMTGVTCKPRMNTIRPTVFFQNKFDVVFMAQVGSSSTPSPRSCCYQATTCWILTIRISSPIPSTRHCRYPLVP